MNTQKDIDTFLVSLVRTSFETDADAKALEGKIATEEETNRRTTIT